MAFRTHKIGLDANRPIITEPGSNQGALASTVSTPAWIADTGASWVRVNFVLGPWASPDDQRRFHGRTWRQAYQTIIDSFASKGLNIYGLIGHEAVKTLPDFFRDSMSATPPQERIRAERWIDNYVTTFGQIAALFGDQVRTLESFNEPDDWHGSHRPWIHPTWFAVMLDRLYREVKERRNLGNLTLVSGPLQGLEINNNLAPTQYLRDTYEYGQQQLGWGMPDRPYPFDGVGYHLYIREGYDPNWTEHEYTVRQLYSRYMNGMLRVIRAAEGPQSTKKLYISEIGWPSNRDTEEERTFQARNVSLALDLMASDPSVAIGIWFCTEDFDPGLRSYGLYRNKQVSAAGRKPSFHAFATFCQRFGRGSIAGTLRDGSGMPRSGYQITLTGSTGSIATTTDVAGAFEFESLSSGNYTLSVVGTSLVRTVTCDGESQTTLDLNLPAPVPGGTGAVRGRLTDQANRPQLGRQVQLITSTVTQDTVTDEQGEFIFEGLNSGIYTVSVVDTELTRPVWCDGETTVDILLQLPSPLVHKGIISGTLTDHNGTPQADREISLTSSGFSDTTTTNTDGGYQFRELSPAAYTVRVIGYDLSQTVWSNGENQITLNLTLPTPPPPSAGIIRGVLRDHTGHPLNSYQIKLSLLNSTLSSSVTTNDKGEYQFDSLPAGTYIVSVVGADTTRPVWLDGQAEVVLDLMLPQSTLRTAGLGIIEGTLSDINGQLQPGQQMTLVGPNYTDSTTTDTDGRYRFEGIAAGIYTISVTAAGVSRHIWSNGHAPIRLDLTL
jgi:protocatechuate 3,4-dioxygenase beta subunit